MTEAENGGETMPKNYVTIDLPGGGRGSINLHDRMKLDVDDPMHVEMAHVEELTEAIINGEYSKPVEGDIGITQCGDGRDGEATNEGGKLFGAIAGYVKSLKIAGLLSGLKTAAEDIKDVVSDRFSSDRPSGGHRADTHGAEGACGCGECDGAANAAKIVREERETVFGFVGTLMTNLEVDSRNQLDSSSLPTLETVFNQSADRYVALDADGYFDNGPSQIDAIVEAQNGDETTVEHLNGDHKEVVWVINLRTGTTEDRARLVADYEDKGLMAFWEDQWKVEEELRQDTANEDGAPNDEAFRKAVVADLTRRVATAMNLTKADLRIIILK